MIDRVRVRILDWDELQAYNQKGKFVETGTPITLALVMSDVLVEPRAD